MQRMHKYAVERTNYVEKTCGLDQKETNLLPKREDVSSGGTKRKDDPFSEDLSSLTGSDRTNLGQLSHIDIEIVTFGAGTYFSA